MGNIDVQLNGGAVVTVSADEFHKILRASEGVAGPRIIKIVRAGSSEQIWINVEQVVSAKPS